MFFMYLMRLAHQLLSNRTSALVVAWRSQSVWVAFAICVGGVRNLRGWRSQSVWVAFAVCVGGVRYLSPKQCI